ncbi:MAG TPA: hypothetical protein VMV27_14255 [Candidatus Binataceae bacterium]|nr:hypothetical protein [Candidatus Binataceae bacterium]
MGWMKTLSDSAKTDTTAKINAFSESTVLGDPADDVHFAAHLAAAQNAAIAAVAGLSGSATMVDVSISCVPDSSPAIAGSYAAGTQISIVVVEKY